MGMAAMNFGNANPIAAALGSLIFGFFQALANRAQFIGWESLVVNAVPYFAVLVILVLVNRRNIMKEERNRSSLMYLKAENERTERK